MFAPRHGLKPRAWLFHLSLNRKAFAGFVGAIGAVVEFAEAIEGEDAGVVVVAERHGVGVTTGGFGVDHLDVERDSFVVQDFFKYSHEH